MREKIGEYLYAEEQPKKENKKTKTWKIVSNKNNVTLGTIYWYNGWRQYVFSPEPQTIYSLGCMEDIIKFIDKQRRLHKLQLINEKEK